MKEQIKCYCGHTMTCDCSPLEEIVPEQKWNTMKQETLEEAAERYIKEYDVEHYISIEDFIMGAKWQQERSYSEEDMNEYADYCWSFSNDNRYKSPLSPKEWFEQFKKK